MALDRYRDFVFTPSDLAEDVELPLDARKEVLYLHARLPELSHWELLGLRWNAPVEAVRTAYLEKARLFHPDRHAARRLGSYKGRMERIFRALTEARDTLVDPSRRAEYARQSAPPEEFARLEARKLEGEARAGERRARLARANPLVARAAKVQELVQRGKAAMAERRFAQAANDFLTALGLDPRHPEARALADEARRKAGAGRARELYDRGLAAEAVGNRGAAQAAYREAAEADPGDYRYAAAASRASLEVGDVEGARALAEAAVRAAPREGRALEALGAVLHRQGDAREAKRALERAVELDPSLDGARALLKKLRWGFLG